MILSSSLGIGPLYLHVFYQRKILLLEDRGRWSRTQVQIWRVFYAWNSFWSWFMWNGWHEHAQGHLHENETRAIATHTALRGTRRHTCFIALLSHLELTDSFWRRDSAFYFAPSSTNCVAQRRVPQRQVKGKFNILFPGKMSLSPLSILPAKTIFEWAHINYTSYFPKSFLLLVAIFRENGNN